MSREQWVEKIIINIFYASDIHIWTITLFNITKHFFSLLSCSFVRVSPKGLPTFLLRRLFFSYKNNLFNPSYRTYFCCCYISLNTQLKFIKLVFVIIITEMLTSCQKKSLKFFLNALDAAGEKFATPKKRVSCSISL